MAENQSGVMKKRRSGGESGVKNVVIMKIEAASDRNGEMAAMAKNQWRQSA
jgi:hypothetical protein